jgi:hypothetical protein
MDAHVKPGPREAAARARPLSGRVLRVGQVAQRRRPVAVRRLVSRESVVPAGDHDAVPAASGKLLAGSEKLDLGSGA